MEYSLAKLPVSQQQLLLPLLKLKQDVGRDNCLMLCDLFENFSKAIQSFSSTLKILQHKADAFHKIIAAGTVHPDVSQAVMLIRGDQHRSDPQEYDTGVVATTTAEQSGLLTVWSGMGSLFGTMYLEYDKLNNTIKNEVLNPIQSFINPQEGSKSPPSNDPLVGIANFIPNLQMMSMNGRYTSSKVQKAITHVLKSHESLQECIIEENDIVEKVRVALKGIGVDTEGMDNQRVRDFASSHLDAKSKTALSSAIRHTVKAKDSLGKHLQELFALAPELRQLAKTSESSESSTSIISLDRIGYQISNAQNCPVDVAENLVNEFTNWEMNRLCTISRALQMWIKIHVECEQKNYSPLVKVWNSLSEDFSPLGDFNSFVKNLMGPLIKSIQVHGREYEYEDVKLLDDKLPMPLDCVDTFSLSGRESSKKGKMLSLFGISRNKTSESNSNVSSERATGRSQISQKSDEFVTARSNKTSSDKEHVAPVVSVDPPVNRDPQEPQDQLERPSIKLPLHKQNDIKAPVTKIEKVEVKKDPPVEAPPTFKDLAGLSSRSGTFSPSLITSGSKAEQILIPAKNEYLYSPDDKPDVRDIKSISHVPLAENYLTTHSFTSVDELMKDKRDRLFDYFENLLNTSIFTSDPSLVDKWSDWKDKEAIPSSSILQRHDLYPVCMTRIENKKSENNFFGIQMNDVYMDSEQWDIATLETLMLVHRYLNSYINHPLLHQRLDNKSKDNPKVELQIFLLANVGLFEHCASTVRHLIDLFKEKKVSSPITNSLLNYLMCTRDSFQSNIFEESFSVHPLDVRYRVALLIDSWDKYDIRIEGINQSIYDFPDFYKWCYRQLHIVHLSIVLKLWRLVRYSPKFGPLLVENWNCIISGGDSVGNFTELFESDSKDEFFTLSKHVSSLLLKSIRTVVKLKNMYSERLLSNKNSSLGKSELLSLLEMMSNIDEKLNLINTSTASTNYNFVCDMSIYGDENLSLLHEWGFIKTEEGCMASCFCRSGSRSEHLDNVKYRMGSDRPDCKYFSQPFEPVGLSQYWSLEEPIILNLISRCYGVIPIDGIDTESASLSMDTPLLLQAILITSTLLQTGVAPNLFVLNSVDKKGYNSAVRPETEIPLIPLYIHSLLLYNHLFNSIKLKSSWNSPRVLISLHVSINAFERLISSLVLLPIEIYAANSEAAIQSHDKYLESAHLSNFRAFQFVSSCLLKGLRMDRAEDFNCSQFTASRYEKNCLALFAIRSLFGDDYDSFFGTSILYLDPFFIKSHRSFRRKLFKNKQVLIDKLPIEKTILRKALHNLVEANIMLETEKNELFKGSFTMGENFEKMSKIVASIFDKARKFERMHRDYAEFNNFRIEFYESLEMILTPLMVKLVDNWKGNEILPCTDKLFASLCNVCAPSEFEDVTIVKEALATQFMLLFKDKFLVGLTRRLDSVIGMVSQTVAKDDYKSISETKGIYYSCWVSDLVSLIRQTVCICFRFSAPIEWLIPTIFDVSERVIVKYAQELSRVLKYEKVMDNAKKLKASAKAISDILEFEDFSDHLLYSEKLDSNYPDIAIYIVSLHNLMLVATEMEIPDLDERIPSMSARSLARAGRKRIGKKAAEAISALEDVISWRIILDLVHLGGCEKLTLIRSEFGLLCSKLLDSLPEDVQKSIYNKAHDALVAFVSYIAKRDLENGHLAGMANSKNASALLSSINDMCIQTCRCGAGDTAAAQSQLANLITFLTISLNTDTPLGEKRRHPKLAKLGMRIMKRYESLLGKQS